MDRVLIVTGGSRGIGAAVARLAAAQGYAVCISYLRNRSAAEQVVDSIAGIALAWLSARAGAWFVNDEPSPDAG